MKNLLMGKTQIILYCVTLFSIIAVGCIALGTLFANRIDDYVDFNPSAFLFAGIACLGFASLTTLWFLPLTFKKHQK
jgi:hypothetical protein